MDRRNMTDNDMWPVTQDRLELSGLYDVQVQLSRPAGGIEWRKGVRMERRTGTARIEAHNARDAVERAALRMAETNPAWNVRARYAEQNMDIRKFITHTK